LHYDERITIEDIRRHFDFDVVIMNTKSRMFMHYNPHRDQADGFWVPAGTERVDRPRIVIEEDYHYEKSDLWYRENRIDLILQRHHSQVARQEQVPMQWLPFSVDTSVFRPSVNDNRRTRKICFAGSTNCGAYKIRNDACNQLAKRHLVRVFASGARVGLRYVKCLQEFIAHVSCSSIYKLSTAKMFEIMSSGSVLLTNDNVDLPLLFPEGSFCSYKEDASDIIPIAEKLIYNQGLTRSIARRGREAILARHTHEIRIKELLEIIKSC
jgi:hypothetical protein